MLCVIIYYYLYTADKCRRVYVTSCRRIYNDNNIIIVVIIMTVGAECARRTGRMTIFLAEEVCGSRPRGYVLCAPSYHYTIPTPRFILEKYIYHWS